jgi:hypothetical protein
MKSEEPLEMMVQPRLQELGYIAHTRAMAVEKDPVRLLHHLPRCICYVVSNSSNTFDVIKGDTIAKIKTTKKPIIIIIFDALANLLLQVIFVHVL